MLIVLGYLNPECTHLKPMVDAQCAIGTITPEAAAELRARASRTMERIVDREIWSTRSTMLAAANVLIAAESFGVASSMIEVFHSERLRSEFGIPDDHVICCLIALGYAARE